MIRTKLLRACSLYLQPALTMEEKVTNCPSLSKKKKKKMHSHGQAERRVLLLCTSGLLLFRVVAHAESLRSGESKELE